MLQSYTFPFLKLVVEIIMTITIPNFNKRTGKVLKTIYNILGVPYLNQYNITVSQLHDFFTDKPNFTPYIFGQYDPTNFDLDNAMEKYHRSIDGLKYYKGLPWIMNMK